MTAPKTHIPLKRSFNPFLILRKSKPISAMILAVMMTNTTISTAHALTADDILNKMSAEERTGYFSGVIDGFAQARWIKDKPNQDGMKCIYDWFYKDAKNQRKRIHSWLSKHPKKPANTLLYVLIKKDCGV